MNFIKLAGCAMLLASVLFINGCGFGTASLDDPTEYPDIGSFLGMDLSVWNAFLPQKILIQSREETSQEAVITDPETIRNAVAAFQEIRIGKEERIRYTDSDVLVIFVFAGDREISIPFEHRNLVLGDKVFHTENTAPLFAILNNALESES